MSDLILHHYNESPYAEKIRAMLGYQEMSWSSVIVPKIAPKPDLVSLTGGYRKVPVLQRGADIYCDTRLIAWELGLSSSGWGHVVEHWVDAVLFGKAVSYTLGKNIDFLPDAFLADRAALRGAPLEREAIKSNTPLAEQELKSLLLWIEQGLSQHSDYVSGPTPGSADFTLYSTLWFAQNGRFDFSDFPATSAWMARMKAMGHGQRKDISAEAAIDIAKSSQPAALNYQSTSPDASGLAIGQHIRISPDMLGHGSSVEGRLVGINADRLTVSHESERAGLVHIHFPRLGYRLQALNGR